MGRRSVSLSPDGGEYGGGGGVNYWARLLNAPTREREYVRELAEQLAVQESHLLKRVQPGELQGLPFAKKEKATLAPNVVGLINHFNVMSRWVCTQVVRQPTVRERARCLRLFIAFARVSFELGNFNGLMEVVAALNSAALFRLKKTWAELSKHAAREFAELDTLVKPEKSHMALRSAMRNCASDAAVPYLGLYLTDVTFIEDGNKNWVSAGRSRSRVA